MKLPKLMYWLAAVVVACVSVAWALVQGEVTARRAAVDRVEQRIIQMHSDLKSDIREIREHLMGK